MSIGITSASFARPALGILLVFGAIDAFAGGYYGLSGAEGVPIEGLDGSPFANYFIPSLILLIVVGGSFMTAAGGLRTLPHGSTSRSGRSGHRDRVAWDADRYHRLRIVDAADKGDRGLRDLSFGLDSAFAASSTSSLTSRARIGGHPIGNVTVGKLHAFIRV